MRLAYYRVSTTDQSIEAQRHAMGGAFDREFSDQGVSGGVMAAERPGFGKLLEHVRPGDTVHVYAVDRLGRDALDVQTTVRKLLDVPATVEVHGLGPIGRGVGELILAVLAQVADLERRRIRERTEAGRAAARSALETTGKTHRGKESLGRPRAIQGAEMAAWRRANGSTPGEPASIAATAAHFRVSQATVKRYWKEANGPRDPLGEPDKAAPEFDPRELKSPAALALDRMRAAREALEEEEAERAKLRSESDPLARLG